MNSLQTASASAKQQPWNVEALFEFKRPAFVAEYLTSAQPTDVLRHVEPVKIVIDLRLAKARKLLDDDVEELGPISEDVLNEVRSRWQG